MLAMAQQGRSVSHGDNMNSVYWTQGRGTIYCPVGSLFFFEKPELSFVFDELHYDVNEAKKVVSGKHVPLSDAEKTEIANWIVQQGPLVNGVDENGNYLEAVPMTTVVKQVFVPPPSPEGWRYDFTAGEGDHWVQLH